MKCNCHKNTWLLCLNLFQSIFKLNCCIMNFTGHIRFGFSSVNICDGFCFVLFLWIWDWLFVVLTSRTQGRPQTKNQKVLFDSFLIVKSMRLYWSKKCLLSFIYKNCCWFLFTYLAYDCFSEKPAYYWIAFFVASERGRRYCFEASKGKHATERASERWWSSRGM